MRGLRVRSAVFGLGGLYAQGVGLTSGRSPNAAVQLRFMVVSAITYSSTPIHLATPTCSVASSLIPCTTVWDAGDRPLRREPVAHAELEGASKHSRIYSGTRLAALSGLQVQLGRYVRSSLISGALVGPASGLLLHRTSSSP
jgi:hypothetical protein